MVQIAANTCSDSFDGEFGDGSAAISFSLVISGFLLDVEMPYSCSEETLNLQNMKNGNSQS